MPLRIEEACIRNSRGALLCAKKGSHQKSDAIRMPIVLIIAITLGSHFIWSITGAPK